MHKQNTGSEIREMRKKTWGPSTKRMGRVERPKERDVTKFKEESLEQKTKTTASNGVE